MGDLFAVYTMKGFCRMILYFLLLFHSCQLYAQSPEIPSNIHIHINNNSQFQQDNKVDQKSNTSSQQTLSNNQDNNNINTVYEKIEDSLKTLQTQSLVYKSWVYDHAYITAGITAAVVYSYLLYQIYQADSIIKNNNSWSYLYNNYSLEQLCALPEKSLESDLLFNIQVKYVDPINPTNFIYSLVQASNSLHKEIKLLEKQIQQYQWLERLYCMSLFFIDQKILHSTEEKYKKLCFIKHVFDTWCAKYKIDTMTIH